MRGGKCMNIKVGLAALACIGTFAVSGHSAWAVEIDLSKTRTPARWRCVEPRSKRRGALLVPVYAIFLAQFVNCMRDLVAAAARQARSKGGCWRWAGTQETGCGGCSCTYEIAVEARRASSRPEQSRDERRRIDPHSADLRSAAMRTPWPKPAPPPSTPEKEVSLRAAARNRSQMTPRNAVLTATSQRAADHRLPLRQRRPERQPVPCGASPTAALSALKVLPQPLHW